MSVYAPVILGLVGPSGSGKTTVCNYLRSFGFQRVHVVTPLKRAFCELFGVSSKYTGMPLIEEPSDKFGGVAPRSILEQLGTKLHEVAPKAIPGLLNEKIARMKTSMPKPWILVDGIRRSTEGDIVHKHGGTVIRLLGRFIDPDKPCDISQLDVRHDLTLRWAPTVEELHAQVDEILERLIPGITHDGRYTRRTA